VRPMGPARGTRGGRCGRGQGRGPRRGDAGLSGKRVRHGDHPGDGGPTAAAASAAAAGAQLRGEAAGEEASGVGVGRGGGRANGVGGSCVRSRPPLRCRQRRSRGGEGGGGSSRDGARTRRRRGGAVLEEVGVVADKQLGERGCSRGRVARRRRRIPSAAVASSGDDQPREQRRDQRSPGLRGAHRAQRHQRRPQRGGGGEARAPLGGQPLENEQRHVEPRGPPGDGGRHEELVAEGAREQGAAAREAGGEGEGGGGEGPRGRGGRGRKGGFAPAASVVAVVVSVEGFGGRNQYISERRTDRFRGRLGQGGGDVTRVGGGCVFFLEGGGKEEGEEVEVSAGKTRCDGKLKSPLFPPSARLWRLWPSPQQRLVGNSKETVPEATTVTSLVRRAAQVPKKTIGTGASGAF